MPEKSLEHLENLKKSSCKIAGRNNVLKSIRSGSAERVFVSKDIDNFLSQTIVNNAQEHNVPITYVENSVQLAKACNISVKTATAAILKQN